MGWLIALAVLVGIAILPVGVRAIYRERAAGVWLLIGFVKIRLYPAKPRKEKKSGQPKKEKTDSEEKAGGKLQELLPLVRPALDFLNQLRKKLVVKNLELKVILAGDDPCDLAVNYGRAWAALGSLMPQLDRALNIRRKNIEVESDFTAEAIRVYARVDVTVSIGRGLYLCCRYGVKFIKDILEIKKLQEGGAEL